MTSVPSSGSIEWTAGNLFTYQHINCKVYWSKSSLPLTVIHSSHWYRTLIRCKHNTWHTLATTNRPVSCWLQYTTWHKHRASPHFSYLTVIKWHPWWLTDSKFLIPSKFMSWIVTVKKLNILCIYHMFTGPEALWIMMCTRDMNMLCHKLEVSTTDCNNNNFTLYKSCLTM